MGKTLKWFARQSPALIVAMIALFVALTGTAVATTSALITGKQIKNSSITGADIKNKSVTAADIRGQLRGARGAGGPAGPAGPQGAQGAQGPQGLQGPAGAPNPNAVDSDKVDGLHANEIVRTSRAVGSSTFTPLTGAFQTIASASVTAPQAGFVVATSVASIVTSTGCPCLAEVRLRDTAAGGQASPPEYTSARPASVAFESTYESISPTYVFPVTAGAHNIVFEARNFTGTGSYGPFNTVVTATFVPFGSTGGGTLGLTAAPRQASGLPGLK